MNPAFGTPTLAVLDNRSQPVRALSYNRTTAGAPLDERIEHTIHDALGRVVSRCDARLFSAHATPNFTYTTSLSGQALRSAGVDAGTQLALADVDGRPVWARDARGTASTWTYDALGRPLTATDTPAGAAPAVRDAWIYGEAESDPTAHNLRGQCVRHYDPAGRLAWSGFRLSGVPLAESRTLLTDPEAEPDWSGDESAWAAALEPVAYPTAWTHDATGAWRTQTDAKGNLQTRRFDVAGRLSASTLTLAGGSARPVLAALDYSAAGQILTETAGNGVVSTYGYEPETQRLVRLTVTRPVQTGRPAVLQDLQYTYDPVGNVTGVTDAAQAPTYWRNQRVAPARAYTYDALYQLISATGRETVNRGQQGTTLPPATIPLPSDDTVYTNYTRTYTYDRGGNLTQIAHQGTTAYTQAIVVSATSNHALAQNAQGSLTPADVDAGAWFDAAGNQQNLLPDRTQPLAWNSRNRLSSVTLVQRGNGTNDRETYQYGADGMRLRKRTTTQTSGTSRTAEAIVLPGLTLRLTRSDDGQTVKVVEALHELRLDAGRTSARVLHWETGLPKDLANDALRFSHGELIGSIGLELDGEAELISREEYYPYGGTAVWSARSQVEADTKYVRYSGKERDSTGLYDYGWRSYQPWLGRWLNPDPAGTVDGLNLFRMVRNNPARYSDTDGRSPEKKYDDVELNRAASILQIAARTWLQERKRWIEALKRQRPRKTSMEHVFFRGDTRPPSDIFKHGFKIKEHVLFKDNPFEKGISVSPTFEAAAGFPVTGDKISYVYMFVLDTARFSYPYSTDQNLYHSALWTRDAVLRDIHEGRRGLTDGERAGAIVVESSVARDLNAYLNPVEIRVPHDIPPSRIFASFTIRRTYSNPDLPELGGTYTVTGSEESEHHDLDNHSHLNVMLDYMDGNLNKSGKITVGTPIRKGWHPVLSS
ncbi:RHS repeat-associated core domain-containing protein [Burkholderia ubonensis]|uniref:RHS repeat-associated core domain-containing protein n=1 Tax=Burkholderia ubonensis TaxID=101571 RepID=UPI000B121DDD|nr:RHS repeat-associated core domain-containing protein [Burkholderia ubonensis]